MQEIKGIIEGIIFKNDSNGYCILEVNTDTDEAVVVVGYFYDALEGSYASFHGNFVEHHTYGRQFKADSYEISRPKDIEGIRAYLASGAVPGIRAAMAVRIINEFGESSLEIMEKEPEKLSRIKGISLKRACEIAERLRGGSSQREAVIFMQSYGITPATAVKIYEKYGSEVYNVIRSNPYELADKIQGIGFKTADAIAGRLMISGSSEIRVRAAIIYILKNAMSNGHTYLPIKELTTYLSKLLEVELADIDNHITSLAIEKKIIVKKNNEQVKVYSAPVYYMEQSIAFMLSSLNLDFDIDEADYNRKLDRLEARLKIEPDPKQRRAVLMAMSRGLMIITGGPGTGKTTVLKSIIALMEDEGLDIVLAAPTGRAAKRMSEATGRDASTIHRLLEVRAGDNMAIFEKNKENPIEADVIIVDEMSMVDVSLMYHLLLAVPVGSRLILTGDADQLPSVGAGNVLKDIIDSQKYSTVILNQVFRQSAKSNIVVSAHRINKGESFLPYSMGTDFVFLDRQDVRGLQLAILIMIKNKLPSVMGITPMDIQVLCPMKKGAVGVEEMNRLLQQHLNPPTGDKREYSFGDTLYREGDKVMQVKNNYQISWEIRSESGFVGESGNGIFNGDIGIIRSINTYAATMSICFDEDKIVEYPFNALDELELAYAVTIHKSQGSEYAAVILPIFNTVKPLMTRNILYTAITRAKSCVCIIGRGEVFRDMIDNVGETKRYSSLGERIEEIEDIGENN